MTPAETVTRRDTIRGGVFLLGASLIWGLAFVPQSMTVREMGPFFATAIRFTLAVPFSLALIFLFRRRRREIPQLRDIVLLGTILYVAFYFQTAAVKIGPVSRVSFITGTYAIFTPFLAPFFFLPKPHRFHVAGALVAIFGLSMLVGVFSGDDVSPFGKGDVLTLCHALLSAVHLLFVARLAARVDPVLLNGGQIVVMAVVAVPVAFLVEDVPNVQVFDATTLMSFFYLALFSSSIAFLFQIAGQRTASAPAASVIMILESPVGAFFALLLLHETMTVASVIGAMVMLVGVGLSIRGDFARHSVVAPLPSEPATL